MGHWVPMPYTVKLLNTRKFYNASKTPGGRLKQMRCVSKLRSASQRSGLLLIKYNLDYPNTWPSVDFLRMKIKSETHILNIRIFVRNDQTNIRFCFDAIWKIISHYFWNFLILLRKWRKCNTKIDSCELNYDYRLSISRLLRITGNIYWLFPINFHKWGVNAYSSKRIGICL